MARKKKVRKLVLRKANKKIDKDMPIGKLTRVKNFLPPPDQLVFPQDTIKKKARTLILRKAKKIRIDAVGFELSGPTKGKISLATDDGGRNLLNSRG